MVADGMALSDVFPKYPSLTKSVTRSVIACTLEQRVRILDRSSRTTCALAEQRLVEIKTLKAEKRIAETKVKATEMAVADNYSKGFRERISKTNVFV